MCGDGQPGAGPTDAQPPTTEATGVVLHVAARVTHLHPMTYVFVVGLTWRPQGSAEPTRWNGYDEAADKADAYRELGTTLTYHPDGRVAVELRPAVYSAVVSEDRLVH
jgi:hypothetical protein